MITPSDEAPRGEVAFVDASDGYPLAYRAWMPPNPSALVVVLHGIQSHSGWYVKSASYLAEQGFAVAAADRRGSGMNIPDRGHVASWRVLVDDILSVADAACALLKDLPIHLIGISWGAKLAAAAALLYPERWTSVVFSGPGFCPQCDMPLGGKLRVAASLLLRPRRHVPIPIGRGEMFTATPRWIAYIDGDPITLRDATAQFYWQSRLLDRYLARQIQRMAIPALMTLGTADRIIDIEQTQRYFKCASSPNNRIIEYNGASHTLEFEPDPEPYFQVLAEWLACKLGTGPPV